MRSNEAELALHVHFSHESVTAHLPYLRSRLDPGITITVGALPADPAGVTVLVDGYPKAGMLAALPGLRALIVPWAGVAPDTQTLLADYPHIGVYNLHHNDAATAETALALMLAAAKWIVPLDRTFRRHDWRPRYDPPPITLLDGGVALILGYGAVGRRLARSCSGLGMTVIATRRTAQEVTHDGVAEVHPPGHLADLLKRALALLITLPLTPETRGLIGAAELALLPAGSLLVNVGRAAIVDEQALYEVLSSGRLAAAALDVWWSYPQTEQERAHTPPSRFPFHELDNVVLSPHRAGMGGADAIERRRYDQLAVALNLAAAGQPIPNPVDLQHGY